MIWFPSFKCWFAFGKKKHNRSPSLMDFNIVDFMDIIACDGCVFWLVNAARVFEKKSFFSCCLNKIDFSPNWRAEQAFSIDFKLFFFSLPSFSFFLSQMVIFIDQDSTNRWCNWEMQVTLSWISHIKHVSNRRSYFNELVSVTIWLEILGCYWWWNLFAMTAFFSRFFSLYRIDKQRKTFLQKNMYVIYITLNKNTCIDLGKRIHWMRTVFIRCAEHCEWNVLAIIDQLHY